MMDIFSVDFDDTLVLKSHVSAKENPDNEVTANACDIQDACACDCACPIRSQPSKKDKRKHQGTCDDPDL